MLSRKSKNSIKGKRIVVFGGAGSIGSELVRQLSLRNKVYIVDINESGIFDLVQSINSKKVWGRVGDIRDRRTVNDVFEDFKPQLVFNCAAYKHVPLMEYTPDEAIQTNIIGHNNVLYCAKTHRETVERLVFISTDKAVSSHSTMGATKRLGEILTINQGFTVVRFGNVLGSRGSLTTIWQRQLDSGQPITITDPRMERYLMTIEEAVSLVLTATTMSKGGEIFVMDMGERVNILELAKKIIGEAKIKFTGLREGETLVEEIMTEEEKRKAIKSNNFWIIK